MKKQGFQRIIAAYTVILMLCFMTVIPALAKTPVDAKETVDVSKKCSLTVTAKSENKVYAERAVKLFQVADLDKDYLYTPIGSFSGYSIELNNVSSQSEWDAMTQTLTAYINADKIAPDVTETTDKDGVVSFTELPVGLYYISIDSTVIAPFVIALPTLGTDDLWVYDSQVYPKSSGDEPDPEKPEEPKEPEQEEHSIIVEWRDDSADKRPGEVLVDIFCDGEPYTQITITEKMNWLYKWTADAGHEWSIAQRNVSEKYTTLIEKRGSQFVITNTAITEPSPSPHTGDIFRWNWLIAVMVIAGVISLLLGVFSKENSRE